jgi:hypothetical protein
LRSRRRESQKASLISPDFLEGVLRMERIWP